MAKVRLEAVKVVQGRSSPRIAKYADLVTIPDKLYPHQNLHVMGSDQQIAQECMFLLNVIYFIL